MKLNQGAASGEMGGIPTTFEKISLFLGSCSYISLGDYITRRIIIRHSL